MQRINIDTINMNQPVYFGNQHIIVIIDCFSRWVELTAAPDISATSAALALLIFIGRYGTPSEIQSDLGPQYVNELITECIKLMCSTHLTSIAPDLIQRKRMLWWNDKTKRFCVICEQSSLTWSNNQTWSINLPMVQRIINTSIHENLGTAPFHILFGNLHVPENHIFFPVGSPSYLQELKDRIASSSSSSSTGSSSKPILHWLLERLQAQDAIISKAAELQLQKDTKHKLTTATTFTSHLITFIFNNS